MPKFTPDKAFSAGEVGRFTPDKGSAKKKKKRGDRWWNVPQKIADALTDDATGLAVGMPRAAFEGGVDAATILSPYTSLSEKKKAAGRQAKGYAEGVKSLGTSEAWTERPLTSALTVLGIAAPVTGAGAVSKLAVSIRAANRTMSAPRALRLAKRESRNPGYLAAQGIKGGLKPRTLKSEIPGGKTREVEFPQARTAIGRAGQKGVDAASKALPKKAPLSERRRANRQIARDIAESERHAEAEAAILMAPVRKVAFGKAGNSKRGNQSLLAYALQTPKHKDPFHGPRVVADKFDEILKKGGYTAADGRFKALTTRDRRRIQAEKGRIRKALDDPPNIDDFSAALAGLEQVAKESDAAARYITQGRARGVSPDEAARLDKVFDDRRNLLSTFLGIQGEARGFFPHRTRFELRNSGGVQGSRGAGDVIGRPQDSVNMKKNELQLFQSARVNTDPRVMEQAHVSHQKFFEAEKNRRELFDEGVPFDKLTTKHGAGYLIRDPDISPAKLSAEQRSLHDPETHLALLRAGDEDSAFAAWRKNMFRKSDEGIPEEWADAPQSVRWVPRDVVDKRLPRRIAVDPDAKIRPIIGTANALARIATIQGKPARYLTTNTAQNIILATLTHPTAAARGIMAQTGMLRSVPGIDRAWRAMRLPDGLRKRRPDLYRRMGALTGDVQATAGLPTIRASANAPQKTERAASVFQHALGEGLGSVADTPYRITVGMKHAKGLGYKSDAQLEKLLTSSEPQHVRARRQVMQATRDDMYDFNRLSVWERDTISRFFFLWPLVRAGVRYPVTYTRDYPVRTGVLATLSADEERPEEGTQARDLFKFAVTPTTEYDTGWAMPQGIFIQQLENTKRVMGGDYGAIGGMFSPGLRDTGSGLFGHERDEVDRLKQTARNLIPGFAIAQDVRNEGVRGVPVVKRFNPQPKSR